jgi:hypothetical protein
MSGATHTQIPIKQRLLHDRRQAKVIALAAVTASAAMLVALVLALGGDSRTTDTTSPAVQVTEPSASQSGEPGIRYDGGPEEGTANVSASRPRVTESRAFPGLAGQATGARADGLRYDGGPEEGMHGVLSSDSPSNTLPGTRYDGGPEEGSRGSGH